jgi:predicted metalloprotease with PDZ domain
MAITGRIDCDGERLARDLEKICAAQVEMFGELPQMEEYLFLTTAVGDGYGGLEHKNSSALMCNRDDLPRPGLQDAPDEGYRRFLGLCSHEYFHLWNVKRIRPKVFMEHDLSSEVHTSLLWAFEGITSYYDDLMLLRSGVIDRQSWLELLAQNITRLMRNRGRLSQTLAESSFDAWTKFYKQDENAINAIVSYYNKGALAALCLDLLMRRDSGGKHSLDDLMRALWLEHGKPGIGVTDQGIEQLAERVSGVKLGGFFDLALRSTDELPLAELLADFGIGMQLRPAKGKDQGSALKQPPSGDQAEPAATLGLRLAAGNEPRIAAVFSDGAAMAAGLAAGDLLVAIDGLKVTQDNLDKLLTRRKPGDEAVIHAFRRDELMIFRATLQAAPADTCDLWATPNAPEPMMARRLAWLGG